MYDSTLYGLYELNNLFTEQERLMYLTGLKDPAKALWTVYNEPGRNQHVQVAYHEQATQAVYMLRYFPHYVEILSCVLSVLHYRIEALQFEEHEIHVSHFGCGPAPELCGTIQFLKSFSSRRPMIFAHLFDIASDAWRYSRRVTLEHITPRLWKSQRLEVRPATFDFMASNATQDLLNTSEGKEAITNSKLVTFQNCLNEIPFSKHEVAIDNIVEVLRAMKPGSVMLIIDRANYNSVLELLRKVRVTAEQQLLAQVLLRPGRGYVKHDCKTLLDQIPKTVTDSLFTRIESGFSHGLTLAKSIPYHRLALRRV